LKFREGNLTESELGQLLDAVKKHESPRVKKSSFLFEYFDELHRPSTTDDANTSTIVQLKLLPRVGMFLACLFARFPMATIIKPPSVESNHLDTVLTWSSEDWDRQASEGFGYFKQTSTLLHSMLLEIKEHALFNSSDFVVAFKELWREMTALVKPLVSPPSKPVPTDSEATIEPELHDFILDWLHTGVCFPGFPQIRKLGVRSMPPPPPPLVHFFHIKCCLHCFVQV
jgi:hypothetical protein